MNGISYIAACSYFAKNIPKLLEQKGAKVWHDFDIEELRGKTMGIVGYGDIGRSTAKLGMSMLFLTVYFDCYVLIYTHIHS